MFAARSLRLRPISEAAEGQAAITLDRADRRYYLSYGPWRARNQYLGSPYRVTPRLSPSSFVSTSSRAARALRCNAARRLYGRSSDHKRAREHVGRVQEDDCGACQAWDHRACRCRTLRPGSQREQLLRASPRAGSRSRCRRRLSGKREHRGRKATLTEVKGAAIWRLVLGDRGRSEVEA